MQRLDNLSNNLTASEINNKDELTLTDNRTGKNIKIAVKESKDSFFIDAKDVGKLKD
jgi:hypothetical protein